MNMYNIDDSDDIDDEIDDAVDDDDNGDHDDDIHDDNDDDKNDRRNSGGTLRQKFHHIDFRHFTFNKWWTTRPLDQWTNETMAQLMTLMT